MTELAGLSLPGRRRRHGLPRSQDWTRQALRGAQAAIAGLALVAAIAACASSPPASPHLSAKATSPGRRSGPAGALHLLIDRRSVTSQLVRLIKRRHPDLTVNVSTYTNGEGALIAVRASPPDVLEVRSDESAARLAGLGVIRPIDTTRIISWPKLLPAFTALPGVSVASRTFMVPVEAEVVGIVYRKDKVTQPPRSFGDLFLPRFKGKVAAPDNPAVAIESAALALQLPDPLALSEDEFTRVKILLKANGGAQFGGFYDGASGLRELLSGPSVVGIASLTDALAVERSGLPIAFRPAVEGQLVWVRGYAITSSCTDVDKAYALLQALAGKEAERVVTRAGGLAANGSTSVSRRSGASVFFTPRALTNPLAIAPVDDRPGWIQTWYEVKAGRG